MVSTHLKNISQIGPSPQGSGENKKYLKPPPSFVKRTFGKIVLKYSDVILFCSTVTGYAACPSKVSFRVIHGSHVGDTYIENGT